MHEGLTRATIDRFELDGEAEGRPLFHHLTTALPPLYDIQLGLERRAVHAALDMLALHAEDRLLDVGTGTGAVLRAVAARAEHPAEMIGLDRSGRMLAGASRHLPRCALVEADATRLPFPEGHFTAVTVVYLLHLLEPPDAELAAAEVRRVARRGGRVAVVVPRLPSGAAARPYRAMIGVLKRVSPTSFGLRPLDPSALLARHGLAVRRASYVNGGYPSVCVLAEA